MKACWQKMVFMQGYMKFSLYNMQGLVNKSDREKEYNYG